MFWSRHKIKILSSFLMLSIALNVGLISWMGGKKASSWDQFRKLKGHEIRKIARDLPPEQRKNIKQFAKSNKEERHKLKREMREKRQEIHQILLQETVDKDALEQALNESRTMQLQAMEMMQDMTLNILSELPAEKRIEIIKKRQNGFR